MAITIILSGDQITVSDGLISRRLRFATAAAAKGPATRLERDPALATKWLRRYKPEQLELQFEPFSKPDG